MEDLRQWLPDPAIETRHRAVASVDPDHLWSVAREVRVGDAGPLGRLVRWRIPGTPADLSFFELFRRYPFTVLDEGERHLVSGLAGRIWTLARDYPELSGPEDFCAWGKRGTVRVAFAHWAEQDGNGGSTLCSLAAIEPHDRLAAARLRALWTVIGRFERLVGAQGVRLAARRAEEADGS